MDESRAVYMPCRGPALRRAGARAAGKASKQRHHLRLRALCAAGGVKMLSRGAAATVAATPDPRFGAAEVALHGHRCQTEP